MSKTVVVLGAKGRFGRNAVEAFHSADWTVIAAGRNMVGSSFPSSVELRTCDVMNVSSVQKACLGTDVIVNAVNPPYTDWAETVPTITENVISAAKASGASVMIPGNVYNFGVDMPSVLRTDTPQRPTTEKGRIRVAMERAYEDAAVDGVQTIVLRGGDFMEGKDTGNWFESHMVNKIETGSMLYPGNLDVVHAWAFLPDMARAMVHLADVREDLARFEDVGFDGFSLTGEQLKRLVEKASGQTLKVRSMPWGIMRLLSIFQPMIREVLEMRYLWDKPHQIDGSKLQKLAPNFRPIPIEEAIAIAIA